MKASCGILRCSTISYPSCHLDNEHIYSHSRNTVTGQVSLMLCLKNTWWLKKRKLITISAAWELLDAVLAACKPIVHQDWNLVWTCFSGFLKDEFSLHIPDQLRLLKLSAPWQTLLASALSGYNSATGNTELLLSWRPQRKCNKCFAFSYISSLAWWPDIALKTDFLKLFHSWEQQSWKKKKQNLQVG